MTLIRAAFVKTAQTNLTCFNKNDSHTKTAQISVVLTKMTLIRAVFIKTTQN
jgi:hypothetical protein